jgi:hypothetical protein
VLSGSMRLRPRPDENPERIPVRRDGKNEEQKKKAKRSIHEVSG